MKKKRPLPYTSADIIDAGCISKRALTRWFASGVLGPPPRRGPRVTYSEETLLRAKAASYMRAEGLRLAEIAQRLEGISRARLEAYAEGKLDEDEVVAATYPAAHCEHVEVAPGLTLVLRADCDPAVRRMAQDIYARFGPRPR